MDYIVGLVCLIMCLGFYWLGFWCGKGDRKSKVVSPSASANSVRDAILLADEYHTTTRSYSREEAAIAGFKRWLRAKKHP